MNADEVAGWALIALGIGTVLVLPLVLWIKERRRS